MLMTMNRDRVIRTTLGHIIRFKEGELTYVPPECVSICMEKGALPAEGEKLPKEPERKQAPIPVGEERKDKIKEAIKVVLSRNQREDFTASGKPHQRVISEMVGFKIDNTERDHLFDEIQNSIEN